MTITEESVVKFMQAVFDMREAQKAYFSQRNDYNLKVSVAKEQIVDNTLQPFLKQQIIKPKAKPSPVKGLFDKIK